MSQFDAGDLVEYAEGQDAAGSGLVGVVLSAQEYAARGGEPWEGSVHVRFPGVTDMPEVPELDQGPEGCWTHYEQPSWVDSFDAGETDDYESVTVSVTNSVTIIRN